MKPAMFQEPREGNKVQCGLCSHRCLIPEGKRGICSVRENRNGTLFTLVYDKIIASNIDPVEKKPLFHFLPGSLSYSIAAPGCNFRCLHCQNADISQLPRDRGLILGQEIPPDSIADEAKQSRCASISYTYTEPTVYFEIAYDTARNAVEKDLKNIFVSNGFITHEALETIAPVLHAANIDLKGFSEEFYRKVCGARLQPVLDAIRHYRKLGIWTEVTTLIIPGYNDSDQELRQIAEFIRSVGAEIPWHVSRFHPTYKLLDQPITPASSLHRARQIGLETGLRYVYIGNLPGDGEDTACWSCKRTVIKRVGFNVRENNVKEGTCGFCGAEIDGVWQ